MSIPGAASPLFIGAAAADAAAYQIDRSLRFSSGDSAYLNRTPSSAGNRKTWTWSGWVKRANSDSDHHLFVGDKASSESLSNSTFGRFYIASNGKLYFSGYTTSYRVTSALLRDFSAWYHLVLAVDTTQSTADDRVKIYINGSQITDFDTKNNPNQNDNFGFNTATPHTIGARSRSGTIAHYLDGYLAEVQFVDGQQLAASDFGEYDSNSVWQPKEFAGTYGPLVDQSQNWSSGTYSGTTPGSGYEVAKAFNNVGFPGDSFGTGKLWGYYPGSATLTLPAAITLTASSTVELYTWHNTGSTGNITFTCSNGSVAVTPVDNANIASTVVSNPYTTFGASITAITVTSSGSDWTALAGIVVDGKLLVDSNVTVTDNSFYLKFADNSSNAALGTDSSGNSNTWTVNNLTAAVVPVDVGGDPTVSSSDKPFTTGFSVAFDGNDKMRMEGPGTVSGDFTWECWVKFTGTPDGRFFSAEESVNGTEYSLMRFYSGNLNVYSGDGNGYEANTYTGSISADTWHHIAMVRSSSTVSHYLDGSRWGTNSFSNSFSITTLVLAHGYSGEYFTGSISNARFVNGQALYTGTSYTVPTATLTTTSQSATASNVTTLVAHKASLTANDGTKIGILNSSSDIDSLIDTPTNYTADSGNNGGNYATLNPLISPASSHLSNGNLEIAATTTSWVQATSTIGVNSGKWYWEVLFEGTNTLIGVTSNPNSGSYIGQVTGSYGRDAGGGYYINGSNGTGYTSFASGTTLGVALDMDSGTVTLYFNGSAESTFATGLDTSKTFYAGVSVYGSTSKNTINFGQRPFVYTPPTGHVSLCTQNLPDPTIADGSTAFDAKLYTGNGSSQTISGLGFSPDFVWVKNRSSGDNHGLTDTVRGATKWLLSNDTNAELTYPQALTAFTSDGFSVGSDDNFNRNTSSFVGWAWDAGTSTASNTDGGITTNVRASQTNGFSVFTYTGTGTAGTAGHGLNATPEFYILKSRSDGEQWAVYHKSTTALKKLVLNSTAGQADTNHFNDTEPTNSVLSIGSTGTVNVNGSTYVGYAWAPVEGFSAFGSYEGTGSATDSPFIFTGMRPAFVLVKNIDATDDWCIADTTRSSHNVQDETLFPNTPGGEDTGSFYIDILSNGFKPRNNTGKWNSSGHTFIYAAFAEHPQKTARAR